MRRINLLPPEERRVGIALPGGVLLGTLLIAGAVAVIFMIGIYVLYLFRLDAVEDDIAQLDQQIAEQNARIAELQPYRDLQERLEAKQPVVDGIYRSQFLWAEFFQNLAFVIPQETSLESLTAQASPINVEAASGQALEPPGSVTFTGLALPRYQNLSDFVLQVNNLNSAANTRLNSAQLDRETFAQDAINFEAESELITEVGGDGAGVPLDELGTEDRAPPLQAERVITSEEER